MTIKLRSKVNFPATVTATGGLKVVKANGAWTVSPDWSYLTLETSIPAPESRQLWTLDPSTNVYYRLSVQALIDNLPAGPAGAAATIAAGTTTTGNAGTSASASNSGTSSAAILDFTIPRGADAGLRYAFESSTSMAAPASGGLRLNNAALASVTAIAVNATNSDAVDVSDFIATWDDSTNTVKGYVEVRKEGSGAVLGLYQLTSVTDNTTWLQLAVTYVSGSGSFTAADSLYLTPYRTGNKGADGTIAGSTGATDNAVMRADGIGGTTLQGSALIVSDTTAALSRSGNGGVPVQGTNTNDDAAAGYVGEYNSSTVLLASAVALTSGVTADITSISLSAGDWDVWGSIATSVQPATITSVLSVWMSTVSATVPARPNGGGYSQISSAFTTGANNVIQAGVMRVSVAAPTTIYLSTSIAFTSGTLSAYGFIGARRMR